MGKRRFVHLEKCIVANCKGKDSKKIRLFRIPLKDLHVWCHNININPEELKSTARICSRHFEPHCIGKSKLKKGAQPTLCLGHEIPIPFPETRTRKIKLRNCQVWGCDSTSPPTKLYKFPENNDIQRQWLKILRLKQNGITNKKKYICKNHFDPTMLTNHSLKKNAMPSKNSFLEICDDSCTWDASEVPLNIECSNEEQCQNTECSNEKKNSCKQCLKYCRNLEVFKQKCSKLENRLKIKTRKHILEISTLRRKVASMKTEVNLWKSRMEDAYKNFILIGANDGNAVKMFAKQIVQDKSALFSEVEIKKEICDY